MSKIKDTPLSRRNGHVVVRQAQRKRDRQVSVQDTQIGMAIAAVCSSGKKASTISPGGIPAAIKSL
ncbi:MAG: hypothetical protein WA919_24895 [Coleofasciculaceae cyanobacterium]